MSDSPSSKLKERSERSQRNKCRMNQIISQLIGLQQKPAPFTPGERLFWDDPHISAQMLQFHLNPDVDAASRRPEIIDLSVNWLIEILALKAGDSLLDLGCGPGLYAARFARAGLQVTGVDYSRRSINYAINYASENGLDMTYRYQNYLELKEESRYDAALLIYGDFCPLDPEQRTKLLQNVYRALKPNGKFVLDVTTREHRKKYAKKNNWYAVEKGFWKAGSHLVLEEGFDYPEESIWLDQYTVIEPDGKVSVYRNWFQDYTPATISAELEKGNFSVESLWGDLTGQPYSEESEWIGLITRKRSTPPVPIRGGSVDKQ
jgi:SAM-dependent methyltransferase